MKYIANFSFDIESKNEHGSFSMVASAPDPDDAVEKFKKKILKNAKKGANGGMFDDIEEIYFDSLIEMDKAPDNPVIMNFKSGHFDDMGWGEISLDLADAPDDMACYGWADEETEDGSEPETTGPFIKFNK